NQLKVTGDLTIKDNTHPVVLDVTMNRFAEHPMLKRAAAGFDATTTIKRSDFGVDMIAPAVSDEVHIRITTEAVVAAPEGEAAAGCAVGLPALLPPPLAGVRRACLHGIAVQAIRTPSAPRLAGRAGVGEDGGAILPRAARPHPP